MAISFEITPGPTGYQSTFRNPFVDSVRSVLLPSSLAGTRGGCLVSLEQSGCAVESCI